MSVTPEIAKREREKSLRDETKDTLPMLLEVEAALNYCAELAKVETNNFGRVKVTDMVTFAKALPTIQELIRRASVAPSVDENACPQCAYKMMRSMCVAYGIDPDKFLQKPFPAPVASGVICEMESLDFENGTRITLIAPDGSEWTAGKYLMIPQPPQAKGA